MNECNYLVVGGTKGIGSAIVSKLGSANCIVFSRTGNNSSERYFRLDVIESQLPELPPLDGLIYCPGTINLKPFHRLTENDFLSDLNVNLIGAVKVISRYLPNLKAKNGSIVLFSTVAVSQGMSFHCSVSAAKGALEGFAKSLAAELAPSVRVNVVAPSLTYTPLAANLLNTEQKQEASAQRHPLKRIGKPEDIADAAVFLLNQSWTTGQVLCIDGGLSSIKSL
jgi:NAD(P)-dependent dehydrogenase (short-subunit alcohol dehydrogenase family)